MYPWIHRSNSTAAASYQISRSLRFRSGNSPSLTRTPSASGSSTTWTYSAWVKRGTISSGYQALLQADNTVPANNDTYLAFNSSDQFDFQSLTTTVDGRLTTNRLFRDPSAWYHIVAVWDTTNAAAGDRMRIYVNGVRETSFSLNTNPALNKASYCNAAGNPMRISTTVGGSNYVDGLLADIFLIDGQALDPTYFGQTDATTGAWSPKAYTGTYGTNGFHLDFSDNSAATAAAIGADRSGNGNNYTPSGISITAGVTNDSLMDTPTNYGTDTGLGGEVRGNYCTLAALAQTGMTAANANLRGSNASAVGSMMGTVAFDGASYWEDTITIGAAGTSYVGVQIINTAINASSSLATVNANQYVWRDDAQKVNNGTGTAYGTALTTGQTVMVAYDRSTGKLWFGSQGTWFASGNPATGANPSFTLTAGTDVVPLIGVQSATISTHDVNFGQRAFAFTAPSGFKALCTQNLSTPTIVKPGQYFNTVLYTGTGTTRSVTGVGFQPDLLWIKSRSGAFSNALLDSVRGQGKYLNSDATAVEGSFLTDMTSFDVDGFSFGTGSGTVDNGNASTYVAWNWKKGATPGLDIVTFTKAATTNETFSHGLGVAPKFMMLKERNTVDNWYLWHTAFTGLEFISLNTSGAKSSSAGAWNSTVPSSTLFSMGTTWPSSTWVNYLFAEVPGFSKFGSYVGTAAADGPFVYCGFRPRFVLVKSATQAATDWHIYDAVRDTINVASASLAPDSTAAEVSGTTMDFVSNGFKIRNTGTDYNGTGQTFIFAAFAEAPFKYTRAR